MVERGCPPGNPPCHPDGCDACWSVWEELEQEEWEDLQIIQTSLKGMAYGRRTSNSLFHLASSANISIVGHLYEYKKVI